MKKYIIFPLLACFALMACEKQEPTPPTQDQLEQKWPEKIETAEMGTFIKIQRDTTQSFYMGDNNSADPTEKPAHQVTFSKSFYMCTLEVTQAQWKAVMGSNPSKEIVGDNLPVNDVTLANVNDFIKKSRFFVTIFSFDSYFARKGLLGSQKGRYGRGYREYTFWSGEDRGDPARLQKRLFHRDRRDQYVLSGTHDRTRGLFDGRL
jgi:formylglycine-generating enzyme required for sulfatase activity